jgi:hypothetical protein
MYAYKATIRFPQGDVVVYVHANEQKIARAMLEAQYGKGRIVGGNVLRCT